MRQVSFVLRSSCSTFTSTPQLFSPRNVGMHSPNPYPDRWEKKKMREKASSLCRAVLVVLRDIDEEQHFRYFMMFASQLSATFQPHASIQRSVCLNYRGMQIGTSHNVWICSHVFASHSLISSVLAFEDARNANQNMWTNHSCSQGSVWLRRIVARACNARTMPYLSRDVI